ncbi:MAG: S49 family peptidase, partial [Methylophagaceae bacterium]
MSSLENSTSSSNTWERGVLEDLAFAALKEQQKTRRWGYIFKGFIALYLVALLMLMFSSNNAPIHTETHTALVDINGVIAADAEANADTVITGIRDAFDNENA